jgi:hypothetical protein
MNHPTTLLVSLEQLSEPQQELARLMDEASHVDIQAHPKAFADLRGILFNGTRYADKVAGCSCTALRLFKFGDEAYTVCAVHGLLAIGYLRREITNGVRRAA